MQANSNQEFGKFEGLLIQMFPRNTTFLTWSGKRETLYKVVEGMERMDKGYNRNRWALGNKIIVR
jgi:hypothetical protein